MFDKLTLEFDLTVTLLDGDNVRQLLSSNLGYSKADREQNLIRVGFVAREVTRHGGMTLCAVIAPYAESRRRFRREIEACGDYIEVYVATPLEVCESRDSKGNYINARAGEIAEYTGVGAPYETPENAEIVVDMSVQSPEEAADTVLNYLLEKGHVSACA